MDNITDFEGAISNAVSLRSNVLEPYPSDPGEEVRIVAVMEFTIARKLEGGPSTGPVALMTHYLMPDATMPH
uniref:Uncharacterized protein n=1 Tax=Aegilops tauschii subsp. strangulata TaxID=200361 RepID=A0A453DSD3_AEGTS